MSDEPEAPARKLNAGCFYAMPVLFVLSALCAIIAVYLKFHGH
ncbi:MAG TPA: hypothetical protein VGO93_18700 [Candidatus Xenobia bacterium]|jgi:hypothetical protein